MAASVLWYNTDLFKKYGIKPPKTYAELTAAEAKLKAAGVAPNMLANQQQWEAQFPFSAYFVNRYGLATYKALIDRSFRDRPSRGRCAQHDGTGCQER